LLRVGLLGTQFTMEQDFYRGRLVEKYALDVLIPDRADREIVHRVIYNELVLGKIVPDSKAEYLRIISALAKAGAEGIILGCTEIGLLVSQADSTLPLFDTTRIHALAAVRYALQDKILPV
jgi:aspartate racemase